MARFTVFRTELSFVAFLVVAHFVVSVLHKAEVSRALKARVLFVWGVIQVIISAGGDLRLTIVSICYVKNSIIV